MRRLRNRQRTLSISMSLPQVCCYSKSLAAHGLSVNIIATSFSLTCIHAGRGMACANAVSAPLPLSTICEQTLEPYLAPLRSSLFYCISAIPILESLSRESILGQCTKPTSLPCRSYTICYSNTFGVLDQSPTTA